MKVVNNYLGILELEVSDIAQTKHTEALGVSAIVSASTCRQASIHTHTYTKAKCTEALGSIFSANTHTHARTHRHALL